MIAHATQCTHLSQVPKRRPKSNNSDIDEMKKTTLKIKLSRREQHLL